MRFHGSIEGMIVGFETVFPRIWMTGVELKSYTPLERLDAVLFGLERHNIVF